MNKHSCGSTCQFFQLLHRVWCIDHALELIAADSSAATFYPDLNITGFDTVLGRGEPPSPNSIQILSYGGGIDKQYAMTCDLTKPVLVVPLYSEDGTQVRTHWVIDGWHRLWAAREKGLSTMPGYLLNQETEQASRRPLFLGARR